jgi:hypothetical protein
MSIIFWIILLKEGREDEGLEKKYSSLPILLTDIRM